MRRRYNKRPPFTMEINKANTKTGKLTMEQVITMAKAAGYEYVNIFPETPHFFYSKTGKRIEVRQMFAICYNMLRKPGKKEENDAIIQKGLDNIFKEYDMLDIPSDETKNEEKKEEREDGLL